MTQPKQIVRPDVYATKAYPVQDATGMVKLDAMENPYQLPDSLREQLSRILLDLPLNRYPVPNTASLEASLRKSTDIPRGAKIMFGNGSDELIDIIIRTCCVPGDVVMAPEPTFVMYSTSAKWSHAQYVGVDLAPDFSLDLHATLRAIAVHKPKVVFLAYPNNPTGLAFKQSEMIQIIQTCQGLVVIDEAYEAFADHSFISQVLEYPNVVVIRTLSKMGLAGIRLGYLVASSIWVDQFNKVRPPYNVNVLTRTVAQFALDHSDVLAQQAKQLKINRAVLGVALKKIPQQTGIQLDVFPSEANFILFRIDKAHEVFEGLKARQILVKNVGHHHQLLHNCIRVTVSSQDEHVQFLTALKATLADLANFELNSAQEESP